MKAILATKIGMTQLYDAEGRLQSVTVLQAGPCVVTQVKTVANDGYAAAQLGFGDAKRMPKSKAGHLKASGANSKMLREVRITESDDTTGESSVKIGDQIRADIFEIGERIAVTAISKGKGFAGTIKRHNFHRGPKTHGSHNYRAPGSIGAGYPQHVFKGIKMAGHMGHEQVTVKNLKIAHIDADSNVIAVVGAVPGPRKSIVMIKGRES